VHGLVQSLANIAAISNKGSGSGAGSSSSSGSSGGVISCFDTLAKVIANVLKSPGEDKFRRLKMQNKALARRVFAYPPATST